MLVKKNLTNILKGISGPENMSVVDLKLLMWLMLSIIVIQESENLFSE